MLSVGCHRCARLNSRRLGFRFGTLSNAFLGAPHWHRSRSHTTGVASTSHGRRDRAGGASKTPVVPTRPSNQPPRAHTTGAAGVAVPMRPSTQGGRKWIKGRGGGALIAQGDLLRPSVASVVHCSEALRVGYPKCKRTTRPLVRPPQPQRVPIWTPCVWHGHPVHIDTHQDNRGHQKRRVRGGTMVGVLWWGSAGCLATQK